MNKYIHSLWVIKYLLTSNRCNLKLIMNNQNKKKVPNIQKKDWILLMNNKISMLNKNIIKCLLKISKLAKT